MRSHAKGIVWGKDHSSLRETRDSTFAGRSGNARRAIGLGCEAGRSGHRSHRVRRAHPVCDNFCRRTPYNAAAAAQVRRLDDPEQSCRRADRKSWDGQVVPGQGHSVPPARHSLRDRRRILRGLRKCISMAWPWRLQYICSLFNGKPRGAPRVLRSSWFLFVHGMLPTVTAYLHCAYMQLASRVHGVLI